MRDKELEEFRKYVPSAYLGEDDKIYVYGKVNLQNTEITSLPDNLNIGGFLDLRRTKITSLPDNLVVAGSLFLRKSKITSLPDNLTIGESLDFECTAITYLPDNLIVGEYLFLEGTAVKYLPDNLTVGGLFNARCIGITDTSKVKYDVNFLSWRDMKYIKVDGIFSEVISHKGNVYRIRNIGEKNITYLVTDGNGKWSHGSTLKEARADLIYKIRTRDKSKYKDLTLDSVLTFEEEIEAYRVITGSCRLGTRDFVMNRLKKKKSKYKISEIIKLTESEYQNQTFKNFFINK